MTTTRTLPMFPLGGVLLPHQVLPLHVFEPRYRTLVQDVIDGDGTFGVCLIARGSEVGGGDVRTDWGAVARILRAEELDDGRWLLVTVGTTRFDVVEWLDDDPYPQARIVELEEPVPLPEDTEAREQVGAQLRRVLAMMAELGLESAPATTPLDEDPLVASFQAAVLAPLGPLDELRLLRCRTAGERFAVLRELLDGVEAQQQLELHAHGSVGPSGLAPDDGGPADGEDGAPDDDGEDAA